MQFFHLSKISQIDFSLDLINRQNVPFLRSDSLFATVSFKAISLTNQSTDGKAHIGTAFQLLDITVQSTLANVY